MILDDIVAQKRKDLQTAEHIELSDKDFQPIASFYQALTKNRLSIIGEIKRASPSKGLIKSDFDPVKIAVQYEKAVDAISVLTEEYFFLGKNEYLKEVHENTKLPILKKDFIITSNQIKEARRLGASAVLLITAILEPLQLKRYIELVKQLQMDSLVEVHNEDEVKIALEAGAKIIGINNRDLKTFAVDLNTTLRLCELIPNNIVIVSESGINTKDDIDKIKPSNVNGILVGESFMRADDIQKKVMEFRKAYDTTN